MRWTVLIEVFGMPKKRFWTERVTELIPIGKQRVGISLVVGSLLFFAIFWLTGFLAVAIDGMPIDSVSLYTQQMIMFCIIGFLAFVGSVWFRNQWTWFFDWTRHILKLSVPEFERFRDKQERLIYSFFPCLAITVLVYLFNLSLQLDLLYKNLVRYPVVTAYWWCFMNFAYILFMGTALWMTISLWIVTFRTLRQPLDLTLSRRTSEEFRPLALWSLKDSLLYFVGLAIVVFYLYIQRFLWGTLLFSGIVGVAILIGVLAFLLPFYTIHRALVKFKKQKLREIEEESTKLMHESNEVSAKHPAGDAQDRLMLITSRLVNLHIQETRVEEADEWPIDTTILSMLAGIVFTPILTKIIIDTILVFFVD